MSRQTLVRFLVVLGSVVLGAGVTARPAEPATEGLEAVLETLGEKGWSGATIDSTRDVGEYLAVGLSPDTGKPYVTYYDAGGMDLWIAHIVDSGGNCGPGSTWKCQVVDSAGDVGKYSSIAVSAGDPPVLYVAYYDQTNGSLKYAQGQCGGTCALYPLAIQVGNPSNLLRRGLHTSVVIDGGWPVISYQATNGLSDESIRVARAVPAGGGNCGTSFEEGFWQCDTIKSGEGIGSFTSLAIHDGQLRLAFYDPAANVPWYAVQGAGYNCGPNEDWWCFPADIAGDDTGTSVSLAVDAGGTSHLAYVDSTTAQLVYAKWVEYGGNCGFSGYQYAFQCEVIDDLGTIGTARTVDLAIDPAGHPAIAYRDASVSPPALMLAVPVAAAPPWVTPNCGPVDLFYTWYCSVLDAGSLFDSEASAVSVDSAGGAMAVAYREVFTFSGSEGNLKVQQRWLDPLFEDGFESGGTGYWTTASP